MVRFGQDVMAVPYLACMALVASLYGLPPRALPSIQAVEGGQAGTVRHDTDGTEDLGVMQVNTRWIAPLAAYTGLPPGVVRGRLIGQPCFNIAAAGAILRTYLLEARGDLLVAVGYYHSHTPSKHLQYRALVVAAAGRLFGSPEAAPPR